MLDVLDALRTGLAPHYSVEREIGAGGMARVYLAVERHPPRKVAIKVMDPELSTRTFRERFIREVELTSRLSHPHIVPILAAEECLFVPDGPDGLCYYVMPYVEGESLRQRLLREKRLLLKDALRITWDVADALSHAHAQGIIHRDIKPENILLSGGHALVADFGIARAVSAAGGGGQTLTGVGQPVGSPAYMSPEQLVSSRAVDARTDIYSLGCVLYELLVGEPPLLDLVEGSTPDRRSLETALRQPQVGQTAARVVKEALSRALATLPRDRFANVDDFAACLRMAERERRTGAIGLPLRRWQTALLGGAGVILLAVAGLVLFARRGPALDPRRVVVAVLENHTGDPMLEPLGHMAADWVTQGLARTGRVEVVPATAASTHAGRPQAIGHIDAVQVRALASLTGAGTVVAGAYYRQGDSVRFQLQVIDAKRGTVLRALDPVGAPRTTPLEAVEAVRQRVTAVFDTLFSPQAN